MANADHTSDEPRAFKHWFDRALILELSTSLHQVREDFDTHTFEQDATAGLESLEFMERVTQIADALLAAMPWPTSERMQTLIAALPPTLDHIEGGTVERGYRFWPFGEHIARSGLDDVDASFEAMIALTRRFSSEFAIRPFLQADLQDSLDRLEALVHHPSEHVRRWVSEGTRTRLPWARAVQGLRDAQDRRLSLLDQLRHDPARYVQRSVANHLQDIVKDDLDAGLHTLERWGQEAGLPTRKSDLGWVVRHASRGLLKAGHPRVLRLFGYEPGRIDVEAFALSHDELQAGENLTLSLALHNPTDTAISVRVDYELTGPTRTGRTFAKTFRWKDLTLSPGERAPVEKRHAFAHRSTRKVYTGLHTLRALINGEPSSAHEVWIEGLPGDAPSPRQT
ncbi:hypothetical protein DL240_02580 [Lujinxingia litoralis]|uniref:DNA alkylation repair protein n=1 Tax=Lujinxingia litoralis TaxID=2211119 RepID=A0A328CAT1_9DELT|nr:hypothetical protein [Lujinxingia litoralis]RAL25118.1 hypothetical protein DL240_02580 [Lujinxingia litoralis]